LRPCCPTSLSEGAIIGTDASKGLAIEVHGGPPWAVLEVLIDGRTRHALPLDGCGSGAAELPCRAGHAQPIVVRHGDEIILSGRTPSWQQ